MNRKLELKSFGGPCPIDLCRAANVDVKYLATDVLHAGVQHGTDCTQPAAL